MRERVVDRRRLGIEGRKIICTKEQGVKNGNNLVAP